MRLFLEDDTPLIKPLLQPLVAGYGEGVPSILSRFWQGTRVDIESLGRSGLGFYRFLYGIEGNGDPPTHCKTLERCQAVSHQNEDFMN